MQVLMCLLNIPFITPKHDDFLLKGRSSLNVVQINCNSWKWDWDWEDHFIFISINCHINSQRFKPNKYITKFTIKIYKPFTIHTSYSEVWNNLNKYILGPRMSVLCANAYNLLPNTVIVIFHQFSFKMLVLSTLMVSLRYGLK